MRLRNRTLKLRLLNKRIENENRLFWQLTNILIPIGLMLIFSIAYQVIRKRKYTRK
jgi:ABC-2 type transport system permease protein